VKTRSIQRKIIIWFTLVLIVILATNFAVLFFIGEKVARDTARQDVREIVIENSDQVRFKEGGVPEGGDQSASDEIIPYDGGYIEIVDFLEQISGIACGVYSSDGKLLYGHNYIPEETKDVRFMDNMLREVRSENDTYYIFDRMLPFEGGHNVWIRGMEDRGNDRHQIYRLYRLYGMLLPLMIIFAIVIVYLATRRAMLPLSKIVDQVGTINWGSDLKARVDTDSRYYEVRIIVDALNKMLSRLEESYEAGRRFTSNVSHDLRTPTAIISAQSELALEDDELDEDAREAFENIKKQEKRIREILDGLLTYIRLEDMPDAYEMEDVDMSDEVRNVCDSFALLDDKDITMEMDIEDGVRIKGNKVLIHTLVDNLLSNAYKYSNEQGSVKVSLHEDIHLVVLSVEDKGIGISEEDQKNIFQWMYRSRESDGREGSGIGLYMVKTIADLHDARISIHSKPGEGSTFTVVFYKN